jgi:hypothetical protein
MALDQLKKGILIDQNMVFPIGAGYPIHVLVPLEVVERDGVF